MKRALLITAALILANVWLSSGQGLSAGVSIDYSMMNSTSKSINPLSYGKLLENRYRVPVLSASLEYGFTKRFSITSSIGVTDYTMIGHSDEPNAPTVVLFLGPQYTLGLGDSMYFDLAAGPSSYFVFVSDGYGKQFYTALAGRARIRHCIRKESWVFLSGRYDDFLLYPKMPAGLEHGKIRVIDLSIGILRSF